MNIVSRGRWPAILCGLLLAGSVVAAPRTVTDPAAPRALPAEGPVQVSWTGPAQFSEIAQSRNRWQAERGDWVQDLAKYLRKQATARLPAGETLAVTITDIKRAGDYEPWRGPRMDDVRIIRDIYPPKIRLRYTVSGADGQVIDQGEPTLTDLGFMYGNVGTIGDSDPLRYEKALIDGWLRKEFPKQGIRR